jgi:hypothetical protein
MKTLERISACGTRIQGRQKRNDLLSCDDWLHNNNRIYITRSDCQKLGRHAAHNQQIEKENN